MAKSLDEFYLAIIDDKGKEISEEDVKKMQKSIYDHDGSAKEMYVLLNLIMSNMHYRQVNVITMIDDNIYNLNNNRFINLDEKKIVCYDHLTDHFSEDSFNIVTSKAKDSDKEIVKFDIDFNKFMDEAFAFERLYSYQCTVEDLTNDFIDDVKTKKRTRNKY